MKKLLLLVAGLLFVVYGCEYYPQDEYKEYYVVESYLVANNEMPFIRLSTTAPIDEVYTFENVAVSGARVEVRLLAEDGSVEQLIPYWSMEPGFYQPTIEHIVQPARAYELYIETPTDEVITATTFVPGAFEIVSEVPDTLVYQATAQLELTLTGSYYPNRQSYLTFNTIALNPDPSNLTPLYYSSYEEDSTLIHDFKNNGSGIFNEATFGERNSEDLVTVRYPWIGIAFYGDNLIVAATVDDNIYDFVRSESAQFGGTSLSPGEIQNAIMHINGGLGIFGAMATDTIKTFIKRPFDVQF